MKAGKRDKCVSLGAISCLEDGIKSWNLFNIDMLLLWPEIILFSKESTERTLCIFFFKMFVTWHCSICLFMMLIYRISTWREPNIYGNCSKCPENTFSQKEIWLVSRWLENDFPSCFRCFFISFSSQKETLQGK